MSDAVDPSTLRAMSVAGICVTVAIGLALLALVPARSRRVYLRIEQTLSRFAERRVLASCTLFIVVVGARLLALPLLPVPVPSVHDEFSYLLMGDTFAHGRLTNPTHPLFVSFETFHVNWLPTYCSKYPPGQGLILAVGQVLGNPWIGVLLSNAAMCVVVFWALQAWMPSRWAFLAAAITGLKLGLTSYWINSYWGGAVAAVGGALVLGGWGRLRRHARARDAILLAVGAAILANSRPYEGFFYCLPAAFWLLSWLAGKIRSNATARIRLRNVLLPILCVLTANAACMAYYNWRLTGNPLLFPHTLSQRTYDTAPLFLWQPFRPKLHYDNAAFEGFYNGWERSHYHTDWSTALQVSEEKIFRFRVTYLWAGGLLVLPALPFVLRDRKMWLFWVTLASVITASFAIVWSQAHYAAPLTCILYGLLVQGMRHLRTMRMGPIDVGAALSRAAILLLLLDTATSLCYRVCDALPFSCGRDMYRTALANKLQDVSGKHLVMVRYGPSHSVDREWVYNGAEIDGAKVLWARELDAQQNAKLFAYFKDRKVWLVTPDSNNTYLEDYTPPGAPLHSDNE